jgi:sulfoxide reductase heme-binding subunit YedZ
VLWILLRAAGIASFVALFLSVAWGLVSTTGVVTKRVTKPAGNHFHAVVASTGLALLTIHVVLLVLHEFMPFDPLDVLVPMRSSYRPVAIALGIVGMYAMVLVTVTSWVRKRMPTGLWRGIHLLAVPAFMLSLLHGVFAGTDAARPGMFVLYAGSALATLFLVLVRSFTYGYRPPRPAPPAGTPARTPARASVDA